jgi:mRNA interferase HicA
MASFKPREVVSILKRLGFVEKRQTGSHLMMYHPDKNKIIPVPVHSKDLKRGLLKAIAKQADSSEEEFLKLK